VLLAVTAPALIRVWVGEGINPSTGLLVGLALWMVLISVGTGLSMFLNGIGVVGLQAGLGTAMVVGKLVLAVVLTNAVGLSGLLWGSVISQVVFVLLPLGFLMPRLIGRLAEPVVIQATLAKA
jgi:O-antigen/teichoic acid export membrane protein